MRLSSLCETKKARVHGPVVATSPIDGDFDDNLTSDFKAGMATNAIARKYGLYSRNILIHLARLGLKFREEDERVKQIKKLFKRHKTLSDVGAVLGISGERVRQLLVLSGNAKLVPGRGDAIRSKAWKDANKIVAAYKAGALVANIAKNYEVSIDTIRKILIANNVDRESELRRKSHIWRQKDEIIEKYHNGSSIDHLAVEYDSSFGAIKNLLHKSGAKVRRPGIQPHN